MEAVTTPATHAVDLPRSVASSERAFASAGVGPGSRCSEASRGAYVGALSRAAWLASVSYGSIIAIPGSAGEAAVWMDALSNMTLTSTML